MSKVILCLFLLYLTGDSYCWFTDINPKMLSSQQFDENDILTDEVDGPLGFLSDEKGFLIFPGTKWCGPGNSADDYDDLGEAKETDMCCREHDHCPDLIHGGDTKHNLTNPAFYTRLNCDCDDKFYDCLKAAGTKTSEYIGIIYFDTLLTKCFREDYPVTGCNKTGGWLKTKCLEPCYDTDGEKVHQWFDLPDY